MEINDASKKNVKALINPANDRGSGDKTLPAADSETPAPITRAEMAPQVSPSASAPKIKCDGCGEVFKLGDQVGHRATCPANKSSSLKCDDCGKTFRSKQGLAMHRRKCKRILSPSGAHRCGSCGKAFGCPGDVKRHIFDCPGAADKPAERSADTDTPRESRGKRIENGGSTDPSAKSKSDKPNRVESGGGILPPGNSPSTPNTRGRRQKDTNDDKTVADGNKKRKRGPSPSKAKNASVSKAKKSRQSEVSGAVEPEKADASLRRRSSKEAAENKIGDMVRNVDKCEPQTAKLRNSSTYVNKKGHHVSTLTQAKARLRPPREVWSQQKSISTNPNRDGGHEKNSDPYPRRSSARSAGKKISRIIKEIMEKDEDGVKNEGEAIGLKSMPSRSSKEAADKKISNIMVSVMDSDELVSKPSKDAVEANDDPKEMPKSATKAPLPHEASPSANSGKDATLSLKNKERDVSKEIATIPNESEARASTQSHKKNPLWASGKTSDKSKESGADESESGDKQRTYEKMSKIVIKRERDEKEETVKRTKPNPPPPTKQKQNNNKQNNNKKKQKKAAAWWDGCKYRCPRCPTEFSDSAAVKLHVECVHSVADDDVKSGGDGGAITIVYAEWSCSMCAAPPIARQRSSVARHLRVAHSLTVDAYDQARAKMMAQYERMKK